MGSLNGLRLRAHQPNFGIDANRYFAAITTPSLSCRVVINTHMVALANAGIIRQLDALYYHLMPTKAQAIVNAVNPGTFNLTESGSVIHTAGVGDAGDGVSAYYQTGLARNSGATKFTQNSAMLLQYYPNAGQITSGFPIGSSTAAVCRMTPRTSGDVISVRINDTLSLTFANTNANGTTAIVRTTSTARAIIQNGVSVASDSRISANVAADTIQIFNDGGAFSNGQVALTMIGNGSWSIAQHAAVHAANALLASQAATACLN